MGCHLYRTAKGDLGKKSEKKAGREPSGNINARLLAPLAVLDKAIVKKTFVPLCELPNALHGKGLHYLETQVVGTLTYLRPHSCFGNK